MSGIQYRKRWGKRGRPKSTPGVLVTRLPKDYYKNKKPATVDTVKRIVDSNIEKKYELVYGVGVTLNNVATWMAVNLFMPAQALGDNSARVGDKVKLKPYFDFNYTLRSDTTGSLAHTTRIIILQWHDMVPSFNASNILQDNTIGERSILSPYSHDEKNRFTILYDRTHITGLGNNTLDSGGVPTVLHRHRRIKIKKTQIQFLNAGTTYKNNQIYLCAFSNVATYAPNISYQAKFLYTDA